MERPLIEEVLNQYDTSIECMMHKVNNVNTGSVYTDLLEVRRIVNEFCIDRLSFSKAYYIVASKHKSNF